MLLHQKAAEAAAAMKDGMQTLQKKMAGAEEAGVVQRPMTAGEKSKEATVGFCQEAGGREDSEYVDDLRCQLAQSFYWSGEFFRDFLFFVCNWHPLVGMALCHPLHPWSKRDRFMTFVVSCSITMLPSALFIKRMEQGAGFVGDLAAAPFIFVLITLPVMLIETALYWLAVGDIFFKGGRFGCLANVVGCVKGGCFCATSTISALALLLSYVLLGGEDPWRLVYPFVMSRVQSYITWFPVYLLLPCIGFLHCWLLEKRALETTYQTIPPP